MTWWALALAGWLLAAVLLALLVGPGIRLRDQPERPAPSGRTHAATPAHTNRKAQP